MKVKGFIISLLMTACTQTMFAQRVILHLSNNQKVEYHAFEVDSITYKNLRYSYPTLILQGATKGTMLKQGFMYGLCIDRIILKSKEEE